MCSILGQSPLLLFFLNTATLEFPLTTLSAEKPPRLGACLSPHPLAPCPSPACISPGSPQHLRPFLTHLSLKLLWSAPQRQPQSTFRSPGICSFHHSCSSGSLTTGDTSILPSIPVLSPAAQTHILGFLSMDFILPDCLPKHKPHLITFFPSQLTILNLLSESTDAI